MHEHKNRSTRQSLSVVILHKFSVPLLETYVQGEYLISIRPLSADSTLGIHDQKEVVQGYNKACKLSQGQCFHKTDIVTYRITFL